MREAATLASTARPSAPPIMNAVLVMPDARPASCGSTSLIAAISTGLKASPPPTPINSIAGQNVDNERAVHRHAREPRRPTRRDAEPERERRRKPKRITSLADSPSEKRHIIRLPGRNARPTFSGL